MTAEEQFKAWYCTTSIPSDYVEVTREAYLAATKATAARCANLCAALAAKAYCDEKCDPCLSLCGNAQRGCVTAIKKEFDLE